MIIFVATKKTREIGVGKKPDMKWKWVHNDDDEDDDDDDERIITIIL